MPTSTFFNLPDEKRDGLIDIALDEFAENDYDGVSITRFVQRAGIAKGSFYQYFSGKDDLLAHLLHLAGERKAAYFAGTAGADTAAESGTFARLRQMIEMGVRFEIEHPRLARLGYRIASGGGYPRALIAEAQAGAHAFFRDLVAQGKADGTIRADVDDDLAAWLFSTVFSDFGRHVAGRLDAAEQEAAAAGGFFSASAMRPLFDQLIAVLEQGLSPHDPAPPDTG
jgi:AcrR family transcriptional regulator